ncbi:MAG: hypothetical protein ACYTEL_11975 [Planctomycetota bacterium]|jgi:hypothetical protein
MVSLNPPDTHIIEMTQDEQMALLKYCGCINDEMRRMLFSALDGILVLTTQQCNYLRRAIEIELDRISNNKAADALGNAYNKLCTNPVMREIGEKLDNMSIQDLGGAQEAADKIMLEHNNTPDPALGGLTPVQTHRLLYTEWRNPDCPMKLNEELSFSDVKDAPLYHNASVLLRKLAEQKDEMTATAKGNLSRKVVQAALHTFKIDHFEKLILRFRQVVNEPNIASIWIPGTSARTLG